MWPWTSLMLLVIDSKNIRFCHVKKKKRARLPSYPDGPKNDAQAQGPRHWAALRFAEFHFFKRKLKFRDPERIISADFCSS